MKLGITILKNEEKLDDILHVFKENNLENITVINSNTKVNSNYHKTRIYSSIRTFLDYYNDESRIILNIVKNEEVDLLKSILKENLDSKQYTFFTIEISDLEGNI